MENKVQLWKYSTVMQIIVVVKPSAPATGWCTPDFLKSLVCVCVCVCVSTPEGMNN